MGRRPAAALALALSLASLAATPGRAQENPAATQPVSAPRFVAPFVRVEAGALNPHQLDGTTMAFGGSVGVAFRGGTSLFLRAVRQSGDRNSGPDLSRDARDILSLVAEQSFGPPRMRRPHYFLRAGGGAMFRAPWATTAVVTLGAGARYQVYRTVTLVGSAEVDVAPLPSESFTFTWMSANFVPVTTIAYIRSQTQMNYGLLLAVEWRPFP